MRHRARHTPAFVTRLTDRLRGGAARSTRRRTARPALLGTIGALPIPGAAIAITSLSPAAASAHPGSLGATAPDSAASSTASTATPSVLPRGNGAWAYDGKAPGLWSQAVASHNQKASSAHRLNRLYSYGSDMEMYCPDGDASKCAASDLDVYYTADSTGPSLTLAYYADLDLAPNVSTGSTALVVELSPIIDGRTDAGATWWASTH